VIYSALFLSALMVAGSVAVLFQRTLRAAALITGAVSLLAAVFFVLMKAYDVAITEASIGAVLSTALYFFALKRMEPAGRGPGVYSGSGTDSGLDAHSGPGTNSGPGTRRLDSSGSLDSSGGFKSSGGPAGHQRGGEV
jgi:uncharacterized MnhB-related membrane protein